VRLERLSNGAQQSRIAERLAQQDGSCRSRCAEAPARSHRVRGRDENSWPPRVSRAQPIVELEAAHARQLNIEQQTVRPRGGSRFQELLRRFEAARVDSLGSEQIQNRLAQPSIVLDDSHEASLL
jgi:hypothetical protein